MYIHLICVCVNYTTQMIMLPSRAMDYMLRKKNNDKQQICLSHFLPNLKLCQANCQ